MSLWYDHAVEDLQTSLDGAYSKPMYKYNASYQIPITKWAICLAEAINYLLRRHSESRVPLTLRVTTFSSDPRWLEAVQV